MKNKIKRVPKTWEVIVGRAIGYSGASMAGAIIVILYIIMVKWLLEKI